MESGGVGNSPLTKSGVVPGGVLPHDGQKIPPEVKHLVQSMGVSIEKQISRSSHPLFGKFKDSPIDKYLDGIQRDDDNAHVLKKMDRWFHFSYFIVLCRCLSYSK